MKRLQHKLTIKQKVIDLSQKLFLEKGYARTTIKDITEQAGITTGSLYHFFRDKEDILRHITKDMFDAAADMADDILGKDGNPWLRFSLEIGMQFYFILANRPIAELYLAAHQSGSIARLIAQSAQKRNQDMFQKSLPRLSSDDFYAMSLSVKGIIHSFVQEAVHGETDANPELIFRAIEMTLIVFQIPKKEMEKTLQATHELIKRNFKEIFQTVNSQKSKQVKKATK
ncbi:MAG: TetR/AcrR family transcriptional regulator [Proteobacteria bacterium]|nr:TetR/AcrR family transcriptional regulator [Pseudomonadota bacterium]